MNDGYFLKCNHCDHLNSFKTEFITFCEQCNQKLKNNYSEWHKLFPDKTVDDFKNEVCISNHSSHIVPEMARKIKSIGFKLPIAIGVSALLILTFVFWHDIANLFLPSTTNESLLEQKWDSDLYGDFGLSISSPQKLIETNLEIPKTFEKYIVQAQSFVFHPSKSLNVVANSMLYSKEVQLSLNGVFRGTMQELMRRKEIKNLEFKESSVFSDDVPGIFIEGSFHYEKQLKRFQSVVYLKKSNMWQVWTEYNSNDMVGEKVAEKIMESVEVSYNIKAI